MIPDDVIVFRLLLASGRLFFFRVEDVFGIPEFAEFTCCRNFSGNFSDFFN